VSSAYEKVMKRMGYVKEKPISIPPKEIEMEVSEENGSSTVSLPSALTEQMRSQFIGSIPRIRRGPSGATIVYEPNSVLSARKGNRKIGANKARLESDYSLVKAERLYEKEGIIRKYVTVSTAKMLRAKFDLVKNPLYTKPDQDNMHNQILERNQEILSESGFTWKQMFQTIGKEMAEYGQSFILKRMQANKLHKIILDDPLFYDAVVDVTEVETDYYVRRPFLRPKPHSEDIFHNVIKALGLNTTILGSGLMSDVYFTAAGYKTGTIGRKKEETIRKDMLIHLKYMFEKNSPFSMPPTLPMAVDIEDLRTLEENLISLGFQYGSPMLHITVDCNGLTRIETDREINRAVHAVENMLSNGFLATTSRVTTKLHYPEGGQVPLDKFAEYLQARIGKMMDMPMLLLGDAAGAGRQSSETIESTANDILQMIAEIVGEVIQRDYIGHIYRDLGGKSLIMPTMIRVHEIDRLRRAADINYKTNALNLGASVRDELREAIGLDPMTDEQRREIDEYLEKRMGTDKFQSANPSNQHGDATPGRPTE